MTADVSASRIARSVAVGWLAGGLLVLPACAPKPSSRIPAVEKIVAARVGDKGVTFPVIWEDSQTVCGYVSFGAGGAFGERRFVANADLSDITNVEKVGAVVIDLPPATLFDNHWDTYCKGAGTYAGGGAKPADPPGPRDWYGNPTTP